MAHNPPLFPHNYLAATCCESPALELQRLESTCVCRDSLPRLQNR